MKSPEKHGVYRYSKGCRCDACKAGKRAQQQRYQQRHPEAGRRRAAAWALANPERSRQNAKRTYEAHKQRYIAAAAEWAKRNPERAKASKKKFRQSERGRLDAIRYLHNRRALQNGAPGQATREQVEARIAYYGGPCWMCGVPWQAIDHVIALSRGGTNWPANLRPACRPCNGSKHVRDYRAFGRASA